MFPAAERPTPVTLDRFANEYALRDELDGAGSVRPLALLREREQTVLVLEDPGGEPLDRLIGAPMEIGNFLRLAIGIATALGQVHARGLVHKDVKPAHILVNCADGEARLTGFGVASRLPREHQSAAPPESIAGTLAYMAPEQTGRMNRSVDMRSDLYAVGVTLYEMLTGALPFSATDPMEWVHCHIARAPAPPAERVPGVPSAISAIVMKCLAKTAEDRYQTAGGLAADLKRCLGEWEADGRITPFAPGAHDIPDTLRIPEKLYGREAEVGRLLEAFDRVVAQGAPELVLVSGYSGVGKSSVVNELHKALVPPRGLFAGGKFDQYKRDIPYAALAQAFQDLIRPLLGKSEDELRRWRDALNAALEPNAALMVTLVPDLKLILGEPPPAPDLPPQDAERRFRQVVRRFIGVFAREQPLALFLDDLQWLDSATLNLLADLATRSEVGSLLLVGAYRDNEVGPTHPLRLSLDAIRLAGGRVQDIVLAPLAHDDVGRLIADAVHCARKTAGPLTDLVCEKTGGNPFFTIQFLTALAEEGLLAFDPATERWVWDLGSIRAKGYTDNVVDLVLGKLARMPRETRNALQCLAALGNAADFATLALVLERSVEAIHAAFWTAVRAGLVLRHDDAYAFLHDRVQEAAYSLIPEASRAGTHLRIGRILSSSLPSETIAERIFDVVNQLNRGVRLVQAPEERERIAELDLLAGKRANASTAYAAVLTYLSAGAGLLADDRWERRYDLAFPLELNRGECEFLTGELETADQRLALLWNRAANTVDRAGVTCLRLALYTTMDRSDLAIDACLEYLRQVGIPWTLHPAEDEVRQEYEVMWRRIGDRPIETLIDLPLMTDPNLAATMDVLTDLIAPALFSDKNLYELVVGRMVNLSLEYGNSDGSCFGYASAGAVLAASFGNYSGCFSFGKLALDLVDTHGLDRFKGRVYVLFVTGISPWSSHFKHGLPILRRGFEAAQKCGDLTFAAYSSYRSIKVLLALGEPLGRTQEEAERALAFVRDARFGAVDDLITTQLALIRRLRGLTPSFTSFDDSEFSESRFEQHLTEDAGLAWAACRYWIGKIQASVIAGEHETALDAATKAEALLWTATPHCELAEFHFYTALAHAGCCASAPSDMRRPHLDALAVHQAQLATWAEICPENFENHAALVAAEIARIEGGDLEAMRLYEEAIRSARENGFVNNEALAEELAARFYLERGFETNGLAHLRNARAGYARWGADGKVRQLDQSYPRVAAREAYLAGAITNSAVPQLDVITLIKASQAVFGEMAVPRLIETLMTITLENAGADRGLLLLSHGESFEVEADARASGAAVEVKLRRSALTGADGPEAVINTVIRTRQSAILDDGARPGPAWENAFRGGVPPRSAFCLPLLRQARLAGVLYLENSQATHAFTPERVAVLEVLGAQAAIALENARLYSDLEQREAKIRRLVEANIVGIFIWDLDGRILEANDAFLRMLGYGRQDLVSGRLSWRDLTPPEWLERDIHRWVPELRSAGSLRPFEKEYFRKDGSRAPVLIGIATFEEDGSEGVAFVVDLTERKRAEADAREGERRYLEMQMELAHANRIATMGQLTASIAHEVRQPIVAAVMNAQAALAWLDPRPPDLTPQPEHLDKARQALDDIVSVGRQAGDVISRIRALSKKAPLRRDCFQVNEAIEAVIALTQSEAMKNGVIVRKTFAGDLPPIHGDQVQLQQVTLNLIINAIEAMGTMSGGLRELLISTEKAGSDGVVVAVKDNGPGIDPTELDRLFQAFYTTKPGGLGMGLSICRSIIEAHGGRLWAEANQPRGAVFQFVVPTEAAVVAPLAGA